MQIELLVFLIGSAASFPLLYWALNKLGWMRRPSWAAWLQRRAAPEKNRDFLNLLRRETVLRANAILRDALVEAEASLQAGIPGDTVLRADTRQRLDDARQLIASLLPGNIQKTYNAAIEDVSAVTPSALPTTRASVLAGIVKIESQLASELGMRTQPRGEALDRAPTSLSKLRASISSRRRWLTSNRLPQADAKTAKAYEVSYRQGHTPA